YTGAAVIEKLSCQRSACVVHTTLPVSRSSATSLPSSWPTNTFPSPSPTPRLVQPQQTDVSFGSRRASYCQRILPSSIDSANTSLAPVLTYAMPSYTTGCASPEYCG